MNREFESDDWKEVQHLMNYNIALDKAKIKTLLSIPEEKKDNLTEARCDTMDAFDVVITRDLIETLIANWNTTYLPDKLMYQATIKCRHICFKYEPSQIVELRANGYTVDMLNRRVYVEDYLANFEMACRETKTKLPSNWCLVKQKLQRIKKILSDIKDSMFHIMNVVQCVLHAAYIPNLMLYDCLFRYLKSCNWTMEQKMDCSTLINDEIKRFSNTQIRLRTNPEEQLKTKKYYERRMRFLGLEQSVFESPHESECINILNAVRVPLYYDIKTISKHDLDNWCSMSEAERLQKVKDSLSYDSTGEITKRLSKFEQAEKKRRNEQTLIKLFHSLFDNVTTPISHEVFESMIYMIEQLYVNQ